MRCPWLSGASKNHFSLASPTDGITLTKHQTKMSSKDTHMASFLASCQMGSTVLILRYTLHFHELCWFIHQRELNCTSSNGRWFSVEFVFSLFVMIMHYRHMESGERCQCYSPGRKRAMIVVCVWKAIFWYNQKLIEDVRLPHPQRLAWNGPLLYYLQMGIASWAIKSMIQHRTLPLCMSIKTPTINFVPFTV